MEKTYKVVQNEAGEDCLEITETLETKSTISKKKLLERKADIDLMLSQFE